MNKELEKVFAKIVVAYYRVNPINLYVAFR